jgi:large subunit ribosomal protein L15
MARKNRKIHKKRGSRTSGHGHHNKNRGAGNRGGVGMAGGHKGRWTWVVRYDPDRFGSRGFDLPIGSKNIYSSINIGALEESLDDLISTGDAIKKGKGYEIDLTKTAYSKVLGSGRITKALSIKADSFSSRAVKKIEEAGGKAEALNEKSET